MERLGFFQRLRGFFMMDWEKKQPARDGLGRAGGDPQAACREERPRAQGGDA